MVLFVCLVICLYPVWRIRQTSVVHMVMVGTRRHIFRNVMIGVQMAISLLFVGGAIVAVLVVNETWNNTISYLTDEEEEHILMLEVNTGSMDRNMDAILSDIKELPEVEAYTYSAIKIGQGYGAVQYINEERSWNVRTMLGSPDYFVSLTYQCKEKR